MLTFDLVGIIHHCPHHLCVEWWSNPAASMQHPILSLSNLSTACPPTMSALTLHLILTSQGVILLVNINWFYVSALNLIFASEGPLLLWTTSVFVLCIVSHFYEWNHCAPIKNGNVFMSYQSNVQGCYSYIHHNVLHYYIVINEARILPQDITLVFFKRFLEIMGKKPGLGVYSFEMSYFQSRRNGM